MTNQIGKNIKLFREKIGVSQEDIANYCGIKREVLSYYENEKREVSLLHLEKISEYLNVDIETFLEENPSEIQPDLALAFRADELTASDREHIVYFKRIVKNYLKMRTINTDGIQA
ncbi:MAG: helix-turn-helix transcriptional regulator [Mariniphaga sp.]|nr:helix-turn-helix transcriptional regulator [Mariniphaga sp.]